MRVTQSIEVNIHHMQYIHVVNFSSREQVDCLLNETFGKIRHVDDFSRTRQASYNIMKCISGSEYPLPVIIIFTKNNIIIELPTYLYSCFRLNLYLLLQGCALWHYLLNT